MKKHFKKLLYLLYLEGEVPAIWHSKDTDYPITIVAFLGNGEDGMPFFAVSESKAGIPLSEIKLPEKQIILEEECS